MTQKRPRSGVIRSQPQDLLPGTTFEVQTTADTAFSFSEDQYTDENGTEAQKCLISIGTDAIFYAYGVDPSTLTNKHERAVDTELELDSASKIKNLQLINQTGASVVDLVVTMFFPN